MVSLVQRHNAALSERAMLDSLYWHRLALTNGKGLLVPLGDSKHGALSGTTVKSIGAEQVTFALAGAASFNVMDTPPKKIGIIPYLTPNQSDEWLETPDAAFWNDTAGASEPSYTWIAYVEVVAGAAIQAIWTKTSVLDETGQDWAMFLGADEKPVIRIVDDSAAAYIGQVHDAAVSAAWHQIAFTKTTGTTSAILLSYLDGALIADTVSETGAYVGQEDGTTVVRLGAESDGGSPLGSSITGCMFAPGYVMSANYLLRDNNLMRAAMGFRT